MAGKLDGKKIAIVVTDGFEQVELTRPKEALEREGATCEIVSPKEGKVKGWNFTDWGDALGVDVPIAQASPDDYDALLLPGGVMNPDKLRVIPEVQAFVRSFFDAGKPVAAICHARGRSSTRASSTGGASPRGRRCKWTSRTPAPSGSTSRSCSTTGS